MPYHYLIVGAGLFGSVFAHEANRRGKKCVVIDKRDHVGGNVYCEPLAGINVHRYGAHIFHTGSEAVWRYMNRFADFNHFINSPLAIYRDELYNLPFNMNTFSRMWNVKTPAQARSIIAKQIRKPANGRPANLEEQALALVGRDIYEKLIKGYTEKQWGRTCTELPAFIIRRLPLRFTYDNNYFHDRFQGIPMGGYTPLIQSMLAGVEVRLNTNYFDWIRSASLPVEKTVFTGPIDAFFGYKLGCLEYRSLRFEQEHLGCENYQGNAVINYTDRAVPYTRIIEHKHFEFGTQPTTIITREYPSEWRPGDEPYYPINDEKNNKLYRAYARLAASEKKVIFGGRLGCYRYYDMDETVAAALEAVSLELKV